ncbi:MAG: sugar ABC transporter substrate-binding protein [candidate division KSB1 bacterium]|nr:sugar ABC transporter substrate-binding protein [candidate division KSB1 bacterium]MDZ7345831.1 sugar ABC transporter substrate-binding protein [candidate division KSB1 bacterium]
MKLCMRMNFVVVGLLLISGIGCGKKEKQITICFSFQDLETEFWVGAHKAITEELMMRGIRVIERNSSQDANRQLEQVRDAIAQQVDGLIIIPQDGQSANTIIGEANRAGIPIAVFNRPPADSSRNAIVVLADNKLIAEKAVDYMVEKAAASGRRYRPCIIVGDLGDPNSIARRDGFYAALAKRPQLFKPVVEVPSKWDAGTTLANFEAAMQANPDIDFVFTSSDFLYPQLRSVLEPLGKWTSDADPRHVILGGIDGDSFACRMMRERIIDATGVQDLFFEARSLMDELLRAIDNGEKQPKKWIVDPGFALTLDNYAERAVDMWGCVLLHRGLISQ